MARPAPGLPGSETRSVVLGTAGHIDHGKTALVLALTGTDTDRLPEEKARGITIELGFAALDLVGPGGQKVEVSFIDVPGHHAFVRNMLAGAGGIDAVMLVVAADEGVKAQTIEHLQICRLLGIERGLVVLTKRDAVSEERLGEARGEVAELVEGTFLEGAPVLAVSALQREGMRELKAAVALLAAEIPARSTDQVPRLPVDRVFTVRGFGTVVTGTLQAGQVRAGESLTLEPERRSVRVRGVQVHGAARAEARAPNRVALNLAGVEVGDVSRGDTLVPEGTLDPVEVLDAEVEVLAGAPALRHRQRIRVHAFAAESLATVLLYEGVGDAVVGRQIVRLRLAKPMVLVPGDRLVLRQPSPARTVGGGRVLDAFPLPKLRKAATPAWLRELRSAVGAEAVERRVWRRGVAGVGVAQMVRETGATREALRQWIALLSAQGVVVVGTGELLLSGEALREVQARVLRELGKAQGGVAGKTELRARVGVAEAVFELATGRLRAAGQVETKAELLGLPGRVAHDGRAPLPGGRAAQVEGMYRAAGLGAPIVSEAAERLGMGAAELRGVLTTLLRAGTLVRMGSDALLVHADALTKLVEALRQHRGKSFDVAWFKRFTGLTRKHAIPLLEYLDGTRVTRNAGGVRIVI